MANLVMMEKAMQQLPPEQLEILLLTRYQKMKYAEVGELIGCSEGAVKLKVFRDGGNTGLIMAMKYPKKVKKLVTMGAVIFIDKTVVDKWVFKTLNKEKKDLINDSSSFAPGRLRRIELLLTEPKHTFEELKKITCPVLVMAGDKDIVREEHTKGIAANIPKGTLLIAPKATHELPWEDAKTFNKAVLEFLNH